MTYRTAPILPEDFGAYTDDPSARSWVNRWCDEQCRFHLTKERSAHGYDPAKERNRRSKPRRP